ncbi:hypothetical protein T02_9699 [Trichinella nativa]|uniref:Uncharacterized protein n=1 Tax=Trichinella nativa TaxID=6335 RepID=A0A0V1KZD4_9BILA|nr:hypothetical protein T02_9699 [Trichinella nativa]
MKKRRENKAGKYNNIPQGIGLGFNGNNPPTTSADNLLTTTTFYDVVEIEADCKDCRQIPSVAKILWHCNVADANFQCHQADEQFLTSLLGTRTVRIDDGCKTT